MGRAFAAVLLPLLLLCATAHAETISIACGAVGRELEFCRDGARAWEHATGHTVRLVSAPNSSSERLALYQQLLAAHAPDVDVLQIDVVWPAILAPHLADLAPAAGATVKEHFARIVASNTIGGRLVAMPWFADVPMLYYRKDLLAKYGLPAPRSWRELATTARRVQDAERAAGARRLWGYVWQGRAYEGLSCNALEWVASAGGGSVVETDGRISIDNPRAAGALARAADWVGTISPPGVLNYAEEEARGVFQSGGALFMRNWSYAWPLLNGAGSAVRGRVGVSPMPAGEGGPRAATLGGWQLAVSRYSRHPELAASLVMYLTGIVEQKRRALGGAYNPTIPALYRDPEVLRANPFYAALADEIGSAVARPSVAAGRRYNRVSSAFWNAAHSVLAGEARAPEALHDLQGRLLRVSRGGKW
jgi:trehalose/maltose transport system substrate-binding protein